MVICPECEGAVTFIDAPRSAEIVECGECRTELEIISIEPLVIALAPPVEEDWGE